MADIIVPDDAINDKRRFRVIPLKLGDADRAGVGEVVVDRETGDFYIRNEKGELKSRTSSIEQIINDTIHNDFNTISYMYNRNRRVYRLFFNSEEVRLDSNLIMDDSCAFYRVRDYEDNAIYYVGNLTPIKDKAVLLKPMVDNALYFVEFYNKKKEMISMIPFSAKAAYYFDTPTDPSESVSYIKIYTNKDFAYVGEDPSSLLVKLYAVYEDGSEIDITEYSTVEIDDSNIDFNRVGTYEINALWIYDVENELKMEATLPFTIKENVVDSITDLIVVPKKIVRLNDNSKAIRLKIVAYFEDGTTEDVSERCIVSNFNDELFNTEQTIVVKFNAGSTQVYEDSYLISVDDNGQASKFVANFNDEFMIKLNGESRGDTPYPVGTVYFRVREAENLDVYYTPSFNEVHYNALYVDNENNKIVNNKNVIVEFYDLNKKLLDSDVYTCQYRYNLDA